VVGAYEAWERAKRPRGRQRKHESNAARRQAWNETRRAKKAAVAEAPPDPALLRDPISHIRPRDQKAEPVSIVPGDGWATNTNRASAL
jgi:hypothetical protein